MNKAIITFANGEKLTVSEGDLLFPLVARLKSGVDEDDPNKDCKVYVTKVSGFVLTSHRVLGLINSVSELLHEFEFFSTTEDFRKTYSSGAVVSIEKA